MSRHERSFSIRGGGASPPMYPSSHSLAGEPSVPCRMHPYVARTALGAVAVALLAIILTFGPMAAIGTMPVGLGLAALLVFALLAALSAVYLLRDSTWLRRHPDFKDFLSTEVPIDCGEIQGRHVLLQIVLIPAALALAFLAIGLIISSAA